MRIFLILYLALPLNIWASTAFINTSLSDQSRQTALGLQHTFDTATSDLNIGLSTDFSRSLQIANYNSSVDDFLIEKNTASLGVDLSLNSNYVFATEARSSGINSKEASIFLIQSRIRFRVSDFIFGLGMTDSYLRQISDFKILNKYIQDQLTLKNQKQTIAIRYTGFRDLELAISYEKYNYDRDLQAMNTILSNKNVLNQNGAAFLSQINSLLDHEIFFDMNYIFNESIDIEATVSESVDFLDDSIRSRGYRIGLSYYIFDFNFSGGASNLKTLNADTSSYAVDATATYSF
jgi:hypothetical protein